MPRIVYFDCPSGAAGDMIMASLIDAGVSVDALRAELGKLPLTGWELIVREVRKGAFRATKVDVAIYHHAHHRHRTLGDIAAILEGSTLRDSVKDKARRIFTRLADAEARVHGTTTDQVHFHDVGAVDAIIDVTGGVIALELIGARAIHVSALPIGGGFVDGAHGRMPIPGPGTAELLRGFPIVDTGVKAELVTPTGAAILTTLADGAGAMRAMRVTSVGYGAGTRDLEVANVLRCLVGEMADTPDQETIVQVETTIDDMSPQLYEPVIDRLFEAGALDVFLTPVVMKRSRPGGVLTARAPPHLPRARARGLFEGTTPIRRRSAEWR